MFRLMRCMEKVLSSSILPIQNMPITSTYESVFRYESWSEMLVMAYGRCTLAFIITRGNNVYGPGQYPEKAIPKFSILASTWTENFCMVTVSPLGLTCM